MNLNNFKWSASSLGLLSSCAEAWRRRYVEGERFPSTAKQLRGQVIHRMAAHSYQQKAAEQTLPSVDEISDLAATDFEASWQKEDVRLDPDDTKGDSKDFAIDLSGYHVQRVAPSVMPIAVEHALSAPLPESDVVVHGVVDLIAVDGTRDVIRDIKSSEKAPQANAAETSLQLTVYANVFKHEMGHFPDRLQLDYLTRSPTKRLKGYIPLTTTRDDEDLKVLGARVQAAVHLVQAGVYLPAPADSWRCSARWCEYYPTCKYVRRGARPTT